MCVALPVRTLHWCHRLKQKCWPCSAASKRWPALLRPLVLRLWPSSLPPACPHVQALVTKSMPKPLAHIGGLKHVIELKLEAGPAGNGSSGDGGGDGPGTKFACPITGQAFNGKAKFVVMRKSGHVVSERAVKEVSGVGWDGVDWSGAGWCAAYCINCRCPVLMFLDWLLCATRSVHGTHATCSA